MARLRSIPDPAHAHGAWVFLRLAMLAGVLTALGTGAAAAAGTGAADKYSLSVSLAGPP